MTKIFFLLAVTSLLLLSFVFAQEADVKDIQLGHFQLDKLLVLGSSILATALFIISITAYSRDKRKRFLFVSIAFLLFSVKGYLLASELFIPAMAEAGWVDSVTSFFDFGILLSFFAGLMKK